MYSWTVVAILSVAPFHLSQPAYPRAELLAEPADVAKVLHSPKLVILDARSKTAYGEGHVPGARWVDAVEWAKSFGDGLDSGRWSSRIGNLGITPDSRVVVYDDNLFRDSARIWWILRYWGIEHAQLLNGGWSGWQAAALPISREAPGAGGVPANSLTPQVRRHASKQMILDALPARSLQLLDARSEAEYCGTQKMAKRGGAIPGAIHLEWSGMIDKQTQRFRPAAELERLFRDAGVDLNQPAAAYCQSGGRSSVLHFTLELMGAKEARNYHGSWAEWGNDPSTPIEPGKPRK